MCELWLIRHGETEWSRAGRHTGRTDVPLTARGEQQARELGQKLSGREFSLVLTSPLCRARDTATLAGYGAAQPDPDLLEWDYGIYEGRTTQEIRAGTPGWSIWKTNDIPGGESAGQVAVRAQRVIERSCAAGGSVALFAHGHLLRILTACWLGLEPRAARLFALSPASLSSLGHEHEIRVIRSWNNVSRTGSSE